MGVQGGTMDGLNLPCGLRAFLEILLTRAGSLVTLSDTPIASFFIKRICYRWCAVCLPRLKE